MSENKHRPQPRASVMAIKAYVPGMSSFPGATKVYKLSSNESPLGPSPKAIDAYLAEAQRLALYPDGACEALKEAIGARYGLEPERILCGNGSDELISLIAHVYLAPGDVGLYSQYGFLEYPIAIRAAGGAPMVAEEEDFTADVDAILRKIGPRARIVFLANPNNPTGSYLPYSEVERLHAALPDDVMLVIDEAYGEYVERNDYRSGLELARVSRNVVVTRTFSKIYGLAALRLGWTYAPPEVVDALNRVRGPFNVNSAAQAAGIAALADVEHVEAARRHNAQWLPWLTEEIRALGLNVLPSLGNFVLMEFPASGPTATAAYAFLGARGFILRPMGGYGLDNFLRLTVGTQEANRGVVAALTDLLRENHGQ